MPPIRPAPSAEMTKTILLISGATNKMFKPFGRCRLTRNMSALDTADAVLVDAFYLKKLKHPPHRRSRAQIYVYLNRESSLRSRYFSWMNDMFNLTVSYVQHPDTDIWIKYGSIVKREPSSDPYKIHTDRIINRKSKKLAWVISNCGSPSARNAYISELGKYMNVDIYGQCTNRQCEHRNCFSDIGEKYWFYLAFENSLCKHYITEKFFRTLMYDVIPIVLGGGNYSAVAPPHSFIDVTDFSSPRQLALYLRYLIANPKEYLKYFQWKKDYTAYTFPGRFNRVLEPLCDILHNPKYQYKTGFDLREYYFGNSPCTTGQNELDQLGLASRSGDPFKEKKKKI